LETQQPCCRSHRLDNQHAWHDGVLRKVTIEERLVDGHVLVCTNTLVFRIHLHHPINQKEWVAVRKVFANFVDIHHVRKACKEYESSTPSQLCSQPSITDD